MPHRSFWSGDGDQQIKGTCLHGFNFNLKELLSTLRTCQNHWKKFWSKNLEVSRKKCQNHIFCWVLNKLQSNASFVTAVFRQLPNRMAQWGVCDRWVTGVGNVGILDEAGTLGVLGSYLWKSLHLPSWFPREEAFSALLLLTFWAGWFCRGSTCCLVGHAAAFPTFHPWDARSSSLPL